MGLSSTPQSVIVTIMTATLAFLLSPSHSGFAVATRSMARRISSPPAFMAGTCASAEVAFIPGLTARDRVKINGFATTAVTNSRIRKNQGDIRFVGCATARRSTKQPLDSKSNDMHISQNINTSTQQLLSQTQHQQQQQQLPLQPPPFKINLLTTPLEELQALLKSWSFPPFHAKQIHHWIFQQGVTSIEDMTNLPLSLREILKEKSTIGSLELSTEQVSKDGTVKRAYRLHDGQLIESVLMPYEDGRRTACISSQAGCAMGCVFCATGQMGFARQLTEEEIFEQVAKFASELKGRNERLSNVVMMGMGEPLANYRNVLGAIHRMNTDLGISARKITISTVGIVPNIRKLMNQDLPVRLALSLHCATDEERSALLPANKRYGGLDELMSTIREYIQVKKSRVTFEWALIEGQNDTKEVARTLGRLLQKHDIRSDMAHVNLIPLNPTGGYGGSPSGRLNVQRFQEVLEKEFGVSATPRMRRGIDIDAGCGQLKASVKKKELEEEAKRIGIVSSGDMGGLPVVGVYEDDENFEEVPIVDDFADDQSLQGQQIHDDIVMRGPKQGSLVNFSIDESAINLDADDASEFFIDPSFEDEFEIAEAERLIALIKGTSLAAQPRIRDATTLLLEPAPTELPNSKSTTITDEDAIREAKRRRKKILKNLKAIQKLKDMEAAGKKLNGEQLEKVAKEEEWSRELESVEHNLM